MDKFKQHVANELKKQGWAKEERDIIMNNMRSHAGERKPEVGSFYYDLKDKKLILVDTISMEKATETDNGTRTTDKLHMDVWEENGMQGNYMDMPRGRVFYNSKTNEYEIMVGDWVKDAPNVKELVIKRFHLENQKVVVKQDDHWDIGNGFDGDNLY